MVSSSLRVIVFHANQCDPKKCTGLRLVRMKRAQILRDMRRIPRRALVLNPVSKTAVSPADRPIVEQAGIVALDCSWRLAESLFHDVRIGAQRALPYLIAANPVNTYKPIKLSTAEAIAAALYIVGLKDKAEDIMSVFKWGSSFLTLNREWLDAYASCKNSTQVVELQTEFMRNHQP